MSSRKKGVFIESDDPVAAPERAQAAAYFKARPNMNRKRILRLFRKLMEHQYDDSILLLKIPKSLQPSKRLSLEERKSEILSWAGQEAKGLQYLEDTLLYLVNSRSLQSIKRKRFKGWIYIAAVVVFAVILSITFVYLQNQISRHDQILDRMVKDSLKSSDGVNRGQGAIH